MIDCSFQLGAGKRRWGRNEARLTQVKERITREGVACLSYTGDLRLQDTIEALYQIALKEGVSVLVNNARVFLVADDGEQDLSLNLDETSESRLITSWLPI